MAILDVSLAGKLKAKKPRKGWPAHLAGGKGGQLLARANPKSHKPSRPEYAWILDFT